MIRNQLKKLRLHEPSVRIDLILEHLEDGDQLLQHQLLVENPQQLIPLLNQQRIMIGT